jgi:heme/copper-type cytochrome/quinol oxidase subunit 2
MRKLLIFFIFISSCSSQAPTSNEIELIPEEESSFKAVTTTLQPKDPDSDHDHDHDSENNKENEETPKPISLLPFDYYLFVPDGVPDKLEVLNYNLGEEILIQFEARDVEKEIHVHGYDIHFMVYPSQDNILKIELTIAGEFEIENHASGYEFARLIVSP